MLTLHDLCQKLKNIDEISLLEVLEISSEDLVERFEDKIEAKFDELSEEFNNDQESCEEESNRKTQEYKRKPKDYLEESLESAYENGDYSIEDDLTPED